MTGAGDPLQLFSAPVRTWFADRVGTPTEAQERAWPVIAAGRHALVTAPTGSGKTLAAFLWSIDRLLTGAWDAGAVRVLYVSPLRALGTDVRRNLLQPLEGIPAFAEQLGVAVPRLRAMTRTGDTPERERRQMVSSPPEILVTTPESLNILLTSGRGRGLLDGVRTVILDEIHAVLGSKRGVHLMTAVERLVDLAGEVQRVALSATVHPLDTVARWVGGSRCEGDPTDPRLRPRPVTVVQAPTPKQHVLSVDLPVQDDHIGADAEDFWGRFAERLKGRIRRNRSTLVFGNSRRTVEKTARFLNQGEAVQLAYSHHGSLSRELRQVVEERLKEGSLAAIVATSSLELGIDIGSIDEVVMVQAPPTAASATQRLGRSGHTVGGVSRGSIVPLHRQGLLEAAVVCRAVHDGELEAVRPVRGALDVLAQVLLSMCVDRTWNLDELFSRIRAVDCYRDLPRRHFDLVVDMLAGRFASTRIRSLRPLVAVDRVDRSVRARPGAARLLYLSGGTIPDRGYFQLRLHGSGAPLGQLDEEFVWERAVGDAFTLGVQSWRIEQITHNDVLVTPFSSPSAMAPFWRAEERDRSFFLSDRAGRLLEAVEPKLDDDDLVDRLAESHHMAPEAAAELVRLLRDQRAATGLLPHRHRVVVEHTQPPPAVRGSHRQIILHTHWGGTVNRPLAYALAAAVDELVGAPGDLVHDDDCVVLTLPADVPLDDPLALVPPDRLHDLLRRRLEHTGFFGARFREAAGCALILPRAGHRRRTPLWLHRQRAKEILDLVSGHGDFPLVLEAWRACLHDAFELDALEQLLSEVQSGQVEVCGVRTERPSPLAAHALWKLTNRLMYEDDRPVQAGGDRLRPDLVREVALSADLRPRIPLELVRQLEAKLQRTADGYAPADPTEVLFTLTERLAAPREEWDRLLAAVQRDHDLPGSEVASALAGKVLEVTPGQVPLVVAVESVPRLQDALDRSLEDLDAVDPGGDPEALARALDAIRQLRCRRGPGEDGERASEARVGVVAEWLRSRGPVAVDRLAAVFDLRDTDLTVLLDELVESQSALVDEITEDAAAFEVCDRENLERLLRMARSQRTEPLATRPVTQLPLHMALHQGLGLRDADPTDLAAAVDVLLGWVAPAEQWETALLPARVEPYHPQWLDSLLSGSDLVWVGAGRDRLTLLPAGGRELLVRGEPAAAPPSPPADLTRLFPHETGRFTLEELARASGLETAEVTRILWRSAWRGAVTTDTFAPVRLGLASGFGAEASSSQPSTPTAVVSRRRRFSTWRASRPFTGTWRRLPAPVPPADALEADELDRDRVRLLLDRYGVVFRELLEREAPALRWRTLFRSLRMLELAGEAVTGRFFDGIRGLQFASHAAVRRLQEGLAADRVWWLSATDPASPCGLGLAWPDGLPARRPTTLLSFHGDSLVLVAERRGSRLRILVPPDHPRLADYLEPLRVQLGRSERPRRRLEVLQINGQPAPASPYRAALEPVFHVSRGPKGLRLSRRS